MTAPRLTVLSLCDRSGVFLRPWAAAGYRCIAVDLTADPREEGGIEYVRADVRDYLPPLADYVLCAAWPPCTHLAVSGVRWFQEKGLSALREAIELVERCVRLCEWTGAPWLIENPVSTLSTYWREPDFLFDPYEFAGYLDDPISEAYTKRTCLWTSPGFILPEKQTVAPILGSKMHRLPPSEDRAELRSVTPEGFARAVFKALHPEMQRRAA